jgi:hypothetical protein
MLGAQFGCDRFDIYGALYLFTIIGRNLLGERPFLLAAEHVRSHERRRSLTDDEQRRAAQ